MTKLFKAFEIGALLLFIAWMAAGNMNYAIAMIVFATYFRVSQLGSK